MKTFARMFTFIGLLLTGISISPSQSMMKIFFNGHGYNVADFVTDTIRAGFLSERVTMENLIRQKVQQLGGSAVNVWILPELSIDMTQKTVANFSTGHLGSGNLQVRINRATVHFDFLNCRIEAELHIRMNASLDVVVTQNSYQLQITNAVMDGEVTVESHPLTPWYQFWNYPGQYIICQGAEGVFEEIATWFFTSGWKAKTLNIKQDIVTFQRAGLTSVALNEAVQSFPVKFTFGRTIIDTVYSTFDHPYFGTFEVQTINYGPFIGLDFMEGTSVNQSAFVGIVPPSVSSPSLDHIGFGNPYGQFQGYNPPINGQITLINKMREKGTHSVRFHLPWRDIVGELPYNSSLNPTNLTETEINALANDNAKWANVDQVVDHALNNKMDVILQIAQGHTYKDDKIIPFVSGKPMAPDADSAGYSSGNGVFYVHENFYLYHLKKFANAAVKRYANKIAVWTIEGELNAARLNHLANLWRFGDEWADEDPSSNGFQTKVWTTLRDAVRQRDPSAKLSTVFHALNIVKGLQRFGPDVDIVGVNLYPNLAFAKPVLGMGVGEMVWATRRALIGLGMGDKVVWVTETNYPAIQVNDPPAGISLKDDMNYFSYNRQQQFMADAIESATNYGAKGFFWWMFLAKDVEDNNLDSKTGFGGILRPDFQFKNPAATEFNQKLLTKHPGKANVRLLNKSGSNPNLGGTISLFGQRDMLVSGDIVVANRDRTHNSRTEQQFLGGLKHLNWVISNQFRLNEPFTVGSGETSLDRAAVFAATSSATFIVKAGGTNITSNVYLGDPWYVDPSGNQPGNLFTGVQGGTSVNVFLGQNPTQDPTLPIYRIQANPDVEHNRVIYNFQNWTYGNVTIPQPTSLQSNIIFNSNASVTANYVAFKPLPPANISMTATAGQNVRFTWTEHPDPNVTQYHIWRYKKFESPLWVGTRNRGTTSWTDASVVVSNGPSAELYFYDIKAYYAPNGTKSDDSWIVVNGETGGWAGKAGDQILDLVEIPKSFAVSNYPNPFNPTTRISYQLPEPAQVMLEVYDITGRRIAELVNSSVPAGYHSVTWNGTGKASGVYLYRFSARVDGKQDVFLRTGKLILTK